MNTREFVEIIHLSFYFLGDLGVLAVKTGFLQ